MKITAIETLRLGEYPNLCYALVHTDAGLTGLGETFGGAQAVEAWIHETAATALVGEDPCTIGRHWARLAGPVGSRSTGVEGRGRSAIDIALWDLLGKEAGQPLYRLLGGAFREGVTIYNTCAGYRYVRNRPTPGSLTANWNMTVEAGPYEDLHAFMDHADDLAESLLEEGFSGMKIWPFDPHAEVNQGHGVSTAALREALKPFEKIRDRVGDRIEVMVEMHSLWDLPSAIRIAKAVEPYGPYWFEDPVPMRDLDAVKAFADATAVPTAASETLGTRWAFRDLLQRQAAGVVIFDPTWTGGVTEAKAIAGLAEAYSVPVAPHDCVGPVCLAVDVHLSAHLPNALIQEVVRAYYHGWYRELVTELPAIRDGKIHPLESPGIGTRLRDEVFSRPDAVRRRSP